jgi:hypothetical protein
MSSNPNPHTDADKYAALERRYEELNTRLKKVENKTLGILTNEAEQQEYDEAIRQRREARER